MIGTASSRSLDRAPVNAMPLASVIASRKDALPAAARTDRWTQALEALRVARAASWRKGAEAQAHWDTVWRLEADLLRPADTLANLAGKLTYLLNISAPPAANAGPSDGGSWRHALLTSAIEDARRLSNSTAGTGDDSAATAEIERLRRELTEVRAERDAFERALEQRNLGRRLV